MNMTAAQAVSLLIKVLPPPAPNTDWLPPAPNEAPISAPFPDWNRTTAMSARHTIMWTMIRNIVMCVSFCWKFITCDI